MSERTSPSGLRPSRSPRRRALLLVLFAALLSMTVLRALVYRQVSGELVWGWPSAEVLRFRATAIAVAVIVGASLAVAGVLLQALLRNPLASPFILGVSGGAALGVMVALYAGYAFGFRGLGTGATAVPALVGAVLTLGAVLALGRRRGWLDPVSLVLVGVVVSAICAALILFLQHLVPQGLRGDLITWMTGSIPQGVGAGVLILTGLIAAAGTAAAMAMGRAMDVATLGDDEARTIGLALGRTRLAMFLMAGVLAAVAVTLAGPIAFVGLVAPHIARIVLGPHHTRLVLGAALVGMTLLVAADVVSQVVSVGGTRIPVGVFTALVGGPAFIWLLRTGRGQV